MATVILGAAGALAAIPFGPQAIMLGWSIGTTIGGIIDASLQRVPSPVADMRVSGSNYGTPIAICYGADRVAANTIWIAKDSNGNHLMRHSGGGKGGGGGQDTYTASWASYVCEGSQIGTGGAAQRTVLTRIWFDDKIVWQTGDSSNPNIRFHNGSPTQTVDSLIASVEGQWTAYRGICYVVFENIDLTPYSNRIPNISFEVGFSTAYDPVTVGDILEDIANRVGIVDHYDFSVGTDEVAGMVLNQRTDGQSAMNIVLSAYFYDLVDVDSLLQVVKRGGDIVLDVSYDDLGAQIGDSNDPPSRLKEVRTQEIELPGKVSLTYFTATTNKYFEQVTQEIDRASANVTNIINLSFPLTLEDTTAKQIMATQLDVAWHERWNYTLSLPPSYFELMPADPFRIPVGPNRTMKRVRCVDMEIGMFGQLIVTAVPDDPSLYIQTVNGGSPGSGAIVSSGTPLPATFVAWSEVSVLRTQDGVHPGFYVASTGPAGWISGTVYYSPDSGTTWVKCGTVGKAVVGYTVAPPLADGTTPATWDATSSVEVTLYQDGELASTSHNAVLAGQNVLVIGKEILGVATATLGSPHDYVLSDLYRGMDSSDMTGHANGEVVVLASTALLRVSVPDAYIGTTLQVKVLSPGQDLMDVTAVSVTVAQNVSPYLMRDEETSVGNHTLYGSGAPGGGLGNEGDVYIDTDTGDQYLKTNTGWIITVTAFSGTDIEVDGTSVVSAPVSVLNFLSGTGIRYDTTDHPGTHTLDIKVNALFGTIAPTPINVTDSPYTVLPGDFWIFADTTGGPITVELGYPAVNTGRVVIIVNTGIGIHAVTVTAISGSVSNITTISNTSGHTAVWYLSTGTDWVSVTNSGGN